MSTPVTDLFGHDCAETECLNRDHWRTAARVALAALDVTAMTAEHYKMLATGLLAYPRKTASQPTLRLVRTRVGE